MTENVKVCLVTGATGFIGQHMVADLVASGRKVLAVGEPEDAFCAAILNDRRIRTTTALPISAAAFKKYDVQFCFGDIADISFLASIFATAENRGLDVEFVLHFAACATIQKALEMPAATWRTNYNGTANILETSHAYWQGHRDAFKGFFYASTDKVYGEGSSKAYRETDDLKPTDNPYDSSKAKADELVRAIAKKDNFPAVIYRFCNVYGPGDYHKSRVVPGTLYRLMYTGTAPVLKKYQTASGGACSFHRDMIYIKDLTRAVSLLLKHLEEGKNLDLILGEAFNLGTANSYAMGDVINKLTAYTGKKITPKEEIVNLGEIKNQCMDYLKLNRALGYSPQYTLEKGLKETAEWYLSHKGEINESFA